MSSAVVESTVPKDVGSQPHSTPIIMTARMFLLISGACFNMLVFGIIHVAKFRVAARVIGNCSFWHHVLFLSARDTSSLFFLPSRIGSVWRHESWTNGLFQHDVSPFRHGFVHLAQALCGSMSPRRMGSLQQDVSLFGGVLFATFGLCLTPFRRNAGNESAMNGSFRHHALFLKSGQCPTAAIRQTVSFSGTSRGRSV